MLVSSHRRNISNFLDNWLFRPCNCKPYILCLRIIKADHLDHLDHLDNLDILHHLDHSDQSNHFDNPDWLMINQEDNCRIRIVYFILLIYMTSWLPIQWLEAFQKLLCFFRRFIFGLIWRGRWQCWPFAWPVYSRFYMGRDTVKPWNSETVKQ